MSTTLRSFGSPTSDDFFVIDVDAGNPGIFVTNAALTSSIRVPRADFLAAVSSELGVVIIDKADMPEVDEQWAAAIEGDGQSAAEVRQSALVRLALADYLEAHPPVDEAQVGALADLLRTALGVTPETVAAGTLQLGSSDDIARRLIATGKVEVRS